MSDQHHPPVNEKSTPPASNSVPVSGVASAQHMQPNETAAQSPPAISAQPAQSPATTQPGELTGLAASRHNTAGNASASSGKRSGGSGGAQPPGKQADVVTAPRGQKRRRQEEPATGEGPLPKRLLLNNSSSESIE